MRSPVGCGLEIGGGGCSGWLSGESLPFGYWLRTPRVRRLFWLISGHICSAYRMLLVGGRRPRLRQNGDYDLIGQRVLPCPRALTGSLTTSGAPPPVLLVRGRLGFPGKMVRLARP